MAQNRPAMQVWSEYVLARIAAMGVNMLTPDAALNWAAATGRQLFRISKRHRERALINLRLSFPEWPEAKVQRVACESFEHFFRLAIEGLNTPRLIHADSWPHRVRFGEVSEAIALLNRRQALFLVTGHIGGFEALGSLLAVMGYPIHALVRPIDNRLIDEWLTGVRERRGLRIIAKWQREIDRMFSVLDAGEALGIVADQNAGDRGMFVPFFGRLASTHKSVGLMAIEREVPIVCGFAMRILPGCRFEVQTTDTIYPGDWQSQPDPLFYVTARYMRGIETMVRRCPSQYLWMHRRWKSRPRYEKQGKPMPKVLRRKLESLPWMDQELMDRLLEPPDTGEYAGGNCPGSPE